MAQTDTRPGFKLPWTADRNDSDEPASARRRRRDRRHGRPKPPVHEEPVTPDMIEPDRRARRDAMRRPTKFMADLSRAMQVAAETSRDETMARFTADAKAVVEEIHNASTVEAAALRRRADDDVAAVREWSKAEIARIREETEGRIAAAQDRARRRDRGPWPRRRGARRTGHARPSRIRGEDGRLLRAAARRGGSDPHRHDGRDDARAARPGRHRRLDRRARDRAVRSGPDAARSGAADARVRVGRRATRAPAEPTRRSTSRGRRRQARTSRPLQANPTSRPPKRRPPPSPVSSTSTTTRACPAAADDRPQLSPVTPDDVVRGEHRLDPRDRRRAGQRRQHRHVQAQPRSRAGRRRHRRGVRPRRRVRLHRQPRCRARRWPTRSPRCPASRRASPPRRPARSRSPHTTPTPASDRPQQARRSPLTRPPSSSRCRRPNRPPSAPSSSRRGFTVLPIEHPARARAGPRDAQGHRPGRPRRRDRCRRLAGLRAGPARCDPADPGPDRRLAAGLRAPGRQRRDGLGRRVLHPALLRRLDPLAGRGDVHPPRDRRRRQRPDPADRRHRGRWLERPGHDDRRLQPEGRRRQDDRRDQPGLGAPDAARASPSCSSTPTR